MLKALKMFHCIDTNTRPFVHKNGGKHNYYTTPSRRNKTSTPAGVSGRGKD